ncbi:hypothetical protein [Candidatus Amarobacter glycogenicus]|uniref:hypothetical protein n=1 Tax=Candidatus Amarobacter glycogenicus TaxID=3140699 RepID=UPI0031CC6C0A
MATATREDLGTKVGDFLIPVPRPRTPSAGFLAMPPLRRAGPNVTYRRLHYLAGGGATAAWLAWMSAPRLDSPSGCSLLSPDRVAPATND